MGWSSRMWMEVGMVLRGEMEKGGITNSRYGPNGVSIG